MLVFENKKQMKEAGVRNGHTFKDAYGISDEKINKKGFDNEIWIMYVGKENEITHNMRSPFSKKHPIKLVKNVWHHINCEKNRKFGWSAGKRIQIKLEEYLLDFKFWLKYRKRDFRISLELPSNELLELNYADKSYEIDGQNILTNTIGITKERIANEIEDRFGVSLDPKSSKHIELIDKFKELVAEDQKKILELA